MTLHRPIPHPVAAPARSPNGRARRPRPAAAPRIDATRIGEEVALPSFRRGAAGRLGRLTFVAGAATLSWAGVIMIARAVIG